MLLLGALLISTGLPIKADAGEGAWYHTPLFELDTRDVVWTYSLLFTLDTRDADEGTLSPVFTLDTRGQSLPLTPLFTLDTRDPDSLYAPTDLLLSVDELTVVRVSWEYRGRPWGFVVERRSPLGSWQATTLSGGLIRSWLDSTVVPGEVYEYRVAAILEPHVWSGYSESAFIETPAIPGAPDALTAQWSEQEDAVLLTWRDRSHNEMGFEVWRKSEPGGIWHSIAQVPDNTTNYLDRSASPSTLYMYRVRAWNGWGVSAFTEEVLVTTPGTPDDGCGFRLLVENAALMLDDAVAVPMELNRAAPHALLRGALVAHLRSPPGNPHPVRVVLGFRDPQGRAAGEPVEIVEFLTRPGCPGRSFVAVVPPGFRVPEPGRYTLWLEMIMAPHAPVAAFRTERHTQESPMRKRLLDLDAMLPASDTIPIRILDMSTLPGVIVDVPIYVSAQPGIDRIEFSVTLDERVTVLDVVAGADAPQALHRVVGPTPDAIGLTMTWPRENPLAGGTMHVLSLRVTAEETGSYAMHFGDAPVVRAMGGGSSDEAAILWMDGTLQVAASTIAGDIYPRPHGDGVVDERDVDLARLYALGLQVLPTDASEFQRLDVAPIDACGDGAVDIADVVAIQLYAAGLLPLTQVCGPAGISQGEPPAAPSGIGMAEVLRAAYMDAPPSADRGQLVSIPILLDAQGNEHGLMISLSFDPELLTFTDVLMPEALAAAVYLPNLESVGEGSLSLAISLPDQETFDPGSRQVAELQFLAQEGIGTVMTSLAFADGPVPSRLVGPDADVLDAAWIGAFLEVREVTATSAPPMPIGAEAMALSTNQLRLSWSSTPWSTGYRIRRKLEAEAGWSVLADLPANRTVYLDAGLPPGISAEYLISALNPLGDESSAVRVVARTWTPIEAWRHRWFGQIENEGMAADSADPDHDNIPNRLEFELGLNPLVPDSTAFVLRQEEVFEGLSTLTLTLTTAVGASAEIAFEATDDLLGEDSWAPIQLAPVSRVSTSGDDEIRLRLSDPDAAHRALFIRMRPQE